MIERKQPVTKQFLLSFKSGHGDFYQKFVSILKGKVHYCRQVKQHPSCPIYMMAEKCIFMSILQRKHAKFLNQEFQITDLAKIFQKYRQQIVKSVSNQKNSALYKKKDIKVQDCENAILQVVTRQNFAFNSFEIAQNTYIYELMKAIVNKSQQINFMGEQKYVQMSYTYLQTKQISAIFGQNIVYFDYNTSKNPPTDMKFNYDTTYILRVKDKYTILYVKQPKFIQIIQEGVFSIQELQSIFIKPQNPKQQGFLSKFLGSNSQIQQKARQTQKLFPDQIECSKCTNKFSQFDCLRWNYQFYCGSCLQNPRLDTSNIPSSLIQKFFRQRGIKIGDYQIKCAQCQSTTHIKRYNPAYKPQKYVCQQCTYTVCLQHNSSIFECFCQCSQCKIPTITIMNLNISICEKCRKRYCRKCKNLSVDFCPCVCKLCFQLNQDDHICKQKCHFCFNHVNKTKICVCGNKICYGCYYYKMRTNSKNGIIICHGSQNK